MLTSIWLVNIAITTLLIACVLIVRYVFIIDINTRSIINRFTISKYTWILTRAANEELRKSDENLNDPPLWILSLVIFDLFLVGILMVIVKYFPVFAIIIALLLLIRVLRQRKVYKND